ncbi:MAG: 4'-phosphopantetheinyl transferase superfamily protein, partial [Actinomycetota bacterium]
IQAIAFTESEMELLARLSARSPSEPHGQHGPHGQHSPDGQHGSHGQYGPDGPDGPAGNTELSPLWMTRFWTAKEATSKAVGTGLGGRPQDFEVRAIDGPALLVSTRAAEQPIGQAAGVHRIQTRVLSAATAAGDHVVAWTDEPVHTRTGGAPGGTPHPRRTVRRR